MSRNKYVGLNRFWVYVYFNALVFDFIGLVFCIFTDASFFTCVSFILSFLSVSWCVVDEFVLFRDELLRKRMGV
jgi:hypothetical protein